MKLIGICGGSGTGKTTICNQLVSLGAYVIDADRVAREILRPPVLAQLRRAFGKNILLADGSLDRKKLGKLVFNDGEQLKKLNEITHPLITQEILDDIERHREQYDSIVVDAAVLHDAGLDRLCDLTVAVCAPPDTRLSRIMARDGISREAALARIRAQKDDEYYIKHTDFAVCNGQNADAEALARTILEKVEQT